MKIFTSLRLRVAALFQRARINADIEEELRSHIEHRADDLERSGLDRAEAERRARIEFGGRERFKEECREALVSRLADTLMQDVRFALRILRKSPGFTVVAVLTLALAIGANAVVFSVLNGLVLRPLNVPRAHDLYMIERAKITFGGWHSYPDFVDLRDRTRSFDGVAAYNITKAFLDTGDHPSAAWIVEASGAYFDTVGIRPYLGRFFHSADEHGPNSAPYVVLSYAYWHSRFHDDPDAVGRTVLLNKQPFTILGVTPPEFHGTVLFFSPDFFVPLVNEEQLEGDSYLNARGKRAIFMVIGRLKAGVTPEQAIADLDSVGAYMEKTYPKEDAQMRFTLSRPALIGETVGRPIAAFVAGLMLLAGLILLAACANLGSLFAARAADRSREVALRLALGATRARILRQLLTEAVLISVAGGALGLFASVTVLRSLSVWQPFSRFPMSVPVNPDAKVYLVALLLALASGLLFGLVPIKQVMHTDPYQVVKSGTISRVGRRITFRDVLIVGQIAICAILVTSSIVALRGLVRSLHSDFGFDAHNATLVQTNLSMAGYTGDAVPAMQKRMLDAVKVLPGVKSVGMVDYPPLAMGGNRAMIFRDDATDLRPANAAAQPYLFSISPEYFEAAGTALLAGRSFSWHDDRHAPHVAVVNREFANKIFGSLTNALGGYYKRRDGTRVEVVGVVEDGKYLNLTERQQPAMFYPILQSPSSETWLVVRSNGDPRQLTAALETTRRNLDAGLPFYIQSWTKEMAGVLFASRMATLALGVLGVMGGMLSMTGIFGMAAYSVSKRLRELGIRMALGAQRKQVLQAALGRPFKLLVFGSAAGLLLGILASRVLAFIVYQATPRDPLVLAGAVFSMLLLGLLATWIPAQRALSVDPLILLREQ